MLSLTVRTDPTVGPAIVIFALISLRLNAGGDTSVLDSRSPFTTIGVPVSGTMIKSTEAPNARLSATAAGHGVSVRVGDGLAVNVASGVGVAVEAGRAEVGGAVGAPSSVVGVGVGSPLDDSLVRVGV